VGNSIRRRGQIRRPLDLSPTDIHHRLDPKHKFARGVYLLLTHRTHGVPTGKGATATGQPLLAMSSELDGVSGGNGVPRQRAPVGDPLNDEE